MAVEGCERRDVGLLPQAERRIADDAVIEQTAAHDGTAGLYMERGERADSTFDSRSLRRAVSLLGAPFLPDRVSDALPVFICAYSLS
jgi:hypothetical protein